MKNIAKCLITLILFFPFELYGQKTVNCDTFSIENLKSYNYEKYLDTPVKMLLLKTPVRKYYRYDYIEDPPGKLKGAAFYLSDVLYFEVYIGGPKHMKIFREYDEEWEFELFLEERIAEISLHYKLREILNVY